MQRVFSFKINLHQLKFVAIVFASFCLVSCDDSHQESKSVFYYNEVGSLSSLDPAFARNFENIWAVNQLYDGLLEFDDALGLKPCLADSFTVSEDAKTYTFYIKNNINFHPDTDGNIMPVTAEDVAYSLQRLVSTSLASPGRWVMNDVERIEDSLNVSYNLQTSTVQIVLAEANASFLYKIAMPYCKIISKQAYTNDPAAFFEQPVGSGPFTFYVWENRVNLVLHKNENYHEVDESGTALPYLDAVSVSFLKDPNAVFLSALNGKFNLVSGLTGEFKDELMNRSGELKAQYADDFVLRKVPYLYTEYLGFYLDDEGAINPNLLLANVRKALSMAINRKKMVQQLRGGIGDYEIGGFVPNVLLNDRESKETYQYNTQKAKEILKAELGEAPYGMIEIYASTAQSDLCELIQNTWNQLGFDVQINIQPNSALGNNIATGKAQVFRKSWIADYPDSENFLSLFYSRNFSPNGPNYTHFLNGAIDSMYTMMCTEVSDSVRKELAYTMDSLVTETMPVIPLYYGEVTHLLTKNVENFNSNAMNILNLKKVKVKSED